MDNPSNFVNSNFLIYVLSLILLSLILLYQNFFIKACTSSVLTKDLPRFSFVCFFRAVNMYNRRTGTSFYSFFDCSKCPSFPIVFVKSFWFLAFSFKLSQGQVNYLPNSCFFSQIDLIGQSIELAKFLFLSCSSRSNTIFREFLDLYFFAFLLLDRLIIVRFFFNFLISRPLIFQFLDAFVIHVFHFFRQVSVCIMSAVLMLFSKRDVMGGEFWFLGGISRFQPR